MIPELTSSIEARKIIWITFNGKKIRVLPIAIGVCGNLPCLKAAEHLGENRVTRESVINIYPIDQISSVKKTEMGFFMDRSTDLIKKGLDAVVFPELSL